MSSNFMKSTVVGLNVLKKSMSILNMHKGYSITTIFMANFVLGTAIVRVAITMIKYRTHKNSGEKRV